MRRLAAAFVAAAGVAAAFSACSRGPVRAKLGDKVRIEYAAYVDDKLFESSEPGKPVPLTIGAGQLPAPAERALIGLRPGERADIRIPDAYGAYDPAEISTFSAAAFGPTLGKQLAVGKVVLGTRGGQAVEAVVKKIQGKTVWLDFNHRLAGKTVAFRFVLVSITK